MLFSFFNDELFFTDLPPTLSSHQLLRVHSIDLIPELEYIVEYSRVAIPSSCQRNNYSVCGIISHVDNIEGGCSLAFVREFFEEESVSNSKT